jgi:hypothetical protein
LASGPAGAVSDDRRQLMVGTVAASPAAPALMKSRLFIGTSRMICDW